MNWVLVLIMWFIFSHGFGQIVNIPDANFKNMLVHSSTSFYTAYDCALFSNYKIDLNNNQQIEANEALAVCQLNLINCNISNLAGIEAFSNLKILRCDYNTLANINLSALINLENLIVRQNQLTSLDISNLPNLKILDCNNNQIPSLNFVNNPVLEKVFCTNNQLNSLDFSSNPLFNELDCMNNPNLTSININNGSMQLFGSQTYYNQCWTGLPNLTNVCADNIEINPLLNFLNNCSVNTSNISFDSNCSLANKNLDVDNVGVIVFPNPSNGLFNIHFINDFKIIVYDILGNVLSIQNKSKESENTIDLSNYVTGIYYAKIIDSNNNIKIVKLIKN